MTCRRALLGFLAGLCVGSSVDCTRVGKQSPSKNPDEVWLSRIGVGAAQTARVCARGATDRITRLLCSADRPPITSLAELYQTLRLDQPAAQFAAAATHSLSLSARTVSALNPRVFVFQNISDKTRWPTHDQAVITAFVRGEQMVELAALDPVTYDFNFYLLNFQQPCNKLRCTPEDLLTERIERGWTSWTLYSDHDLVDTPLDCISCHQPFGPGTHKQFLMRQDQDPWMHWSDFRGGDERALCANPPPDGGPGKTVVTVDGLNHLRNAEGADGRYAAIPLTELVTAKSGEIFSTFLTDAEGLARLSPYGVKNNYAYGQLDFSTRLVLCERFHTGSSPSWEKYKRQSQERGLPVPHYTPDVTDPKRGAEVIGDRPGFLQRHAAEDAFAVAASLLSPEIPAAVGFVPAAEDSAETILRAMCVRCHSNTTDARLRRARFNAEALGQVSSETADLVRKRLSLPKSSPELMPPLRVGELPPWAIARVSAYLSK